jgi:hypothetical protein
LDLGLRLDPYYALASKVLWSRHSPSLSRICIRTPQKILERQAGWVGCTDKCEQLRKGPSLITQTEQ